MMKATGYTPAVLRQVECWLPLAQDVARTYEWNDDPAALETLVVAALPALSQASTELEARMVLWLWRQRAVADT